MQGKKLSLMKRNFRVGDTISLSLRDGHLVSGIVYICSSIPMGKFYAKQFGKPTVGSEDIYEDALVLINNKKPGTLAVLTLEQDNNKFFTWNDVFEPGDTEYRPIENLQAIDVKYSMSLLTEMVYSFK